MLKKTAKNNLDDFVPKKGISKRMSTYYFSKPATAPLASRVGGQYNSLKPPLELILLKKPKTFLGPMFLPKIVREKNKKKPYYFV